MSRHRVINTQQRGLAGSELYVFLDWSGMRANHVTMAFEDVVLAHRDTYALPLQESPGTGFFYADMPDWITMACVLDVTFYKQAGGTRAQSDHEYGGQVIRWTGQGIEQVETAESAGTGTVLVDHTYGATLSDLTPLAIMSEGNVPVLDATIQVFYKTDYLANKRSSAFIVGVSSTDRNGFWRNPILLDPDDYILLVFSTARTFDARTFPLTVT